MQDNKIFKVIQITDCHLFKDDSLMLDVPTNKTFNAVIEHIKKEELQDTDAIFLTGDLSQDESKESYQRIVNLLGDIKKNIYWIPGNHDCITTMSNVFSENNQFIHTNHFHTDHWAFIFLNTKIDRNDYGFLSDLELDKLRRSLNQNSDKSIAIVMHHQPAPVGTPMIDHCMLQQANLFWEAISSYSVKVILCGHVHGDYSVKYNEQVTIEASPATCIQWVKGSIQPKFENKMGYKIYHFKKNNYVAKARIWNNEKNYS